jgi:hypothetical protein
MFGFVFLVVLGSSIWVYFDAKNIGARNGLGSGFLDMGPCGWFVACILLWIVAFPIYLAVRSKIQKAAAENLSCEKGTLPEWVKTSSDYERWKKGLK